MTLIEVMIAVAIMGMLGLMSYGAIRSLSLGVRPRWCAPIAFGKGVRRCRGSRANCRVLTSRATIRQLFRRRRARRRSLARPDPVRATRLCRFAHRRVESGAPESDQAEVGYFGADNPDAPGKTDLMRREQSPVDMEPARGGNVDVLAEDIEELQFKYFDGVAQKWVDRWDSATPMAPPIACLCMCTC